MTKDELDKMIADYNARIDAKFQQSWAKAEAWAKASEKKGFERGFIRGCAFITIIYWLLFLALK